jgi:hypothetical protein
MPKAILKRKKEASMAKRPLVLAWVLMVWATGAAAQSRDVLIGNWKLLSATETTAKGEINNEPFGPNPKGFLTYTADGRVMAIITYGGRKALSINDRVSAPGEERAEAFASMFAYAGRYTLSDERVIHHVEAASVPNWVDTDLVRLVKIEGDHLTLRTPPGQLKSGMKMGGTALVWERLK